MAGADQRQTERFEVEQAVEVSKGETVLGATMVDLSLGGLRIRFETQTEGIAIGDHVRVSFAIPTASAPLRADAEVRWRSSLDTNIFGLQFLTGFRAKETWALGRFLEQLGRPG